MKGPIRQMVDNMQNWAKASGLTLEQVADVFDKVNLLNHSSSSDDKPTTLASMTPAKGKH